MVQSLPRGYQISETIRIRRLLCGEQSWQIYSSNQNTYVLSVTSELIKVWEGVNPSTRDIFAYMSDIERWIHVSSSAEYLVSSLGKGPYPEKSSQIEAFSYTFGRFRRNHPNVFFDDAVYIEEYSMLLPIVTTNPAVDYSLMYGQWLTGGVAISGANIERIGTFMSWLPREVLVKYAKEAGIDAAVTDVATLEQHTDVCDVPFSLSGRPELERFFNENIIDIIKSPDEYARMGIGFPGATILYGPPGCGKTYAVDRLTEYLGWNRFDINSSTVASPYIHDTSKKVSEVFSQAIASAPSILVIDEMEAYLSNRNASAATGSHHVEEVAEFLRRIPEAVEHHVLIFAMTNMLDSIDPAIVRKGRFDHMVEVKMASEKEIEILLLAKFKDLPVAADVSPAGIAVSLAGKPLSDVTYVIKEAGRIAARHRKKEMDRSCFEQALSTMPVEKAQRRIGF